MIAYNCSMDDLEKALLIINEKYKRNIQFKNLKNAGRRVIFTLRVKDSYNLGHRRGLSYNGKPGRRMPSACWHVHGDFFDALFEINPEAKIKSSKNSDFITVNSGNWIDSNIGSIIQPFLFSEACDCDKDFS